MRDLNNGTLEAGDLCVNDRKKLVGLGQGRRYPSRACTEIFEPDVGLSGSCVCLYMQVKTDGKVRSNCDYRRYGDPCDRGVPR